MKATGFVFMRKIKPQHLVLPDLFQRNLHLNMYFHPWQYLLTSYCFIHASDPETTQFLRQTAVLLKTWLSGVLPAAGIAVIVPTAAA